MITRKTQCFNPFKAARGKDLPGFTLVELLVVIVIIATLIGVSFAMFKKARMAAAKTSAINQMREISVAVLQWAAEKNTGEPFYAADGDGTYGNESVPGVDPLLAPGNPALLLYNRAEPEEGYLVDHTLFFSPLNKIKAPAREDYAPQDAAPARPWGTYAWYYPSNVLDQLTERQRNAMGDWSLSRVSASAAGKLMFASDYHDSAPLWEPSYLAMMVDGSALEVATSESGWNTWAWGR